MKTWRRVELLILLLILVFACGCPNAAAQQITITGTVEDINGTPYTAGTGTAILVVPGNQQATINGQPYQQTQVIIGLGSSATFSINIYPNSAFDQTGTQWKFNFCDRTAVFCFTIPAATYNANTNITAAIQAVAPILNFGGNAFNSIGVGTGYQDVKEIPAPSDPFTGNDRLYLDQTTHLLSCITSTGATCNPSGSAGLSSTAVGFGSGSSNLTGDPTNFFYTLGTHVLSVLGGISVPAGALGGNVALQVFPTDGALYVSPSGSDSNNGKSPGAAMLTAYHAACSLPGGNCSTQTLGNGTVYLYPGSAWNATSTCGMWIMGSNDPNFASPPACWLKQTSGSLGIVTFVGIPNKQYGPNGQMGVAAITGGGNNHSQPGIWLSGTTTTVFKNIAVGVIGTALQRGIVVGECSTGTRTDTCNASGFTFDNVNAVDNLGASGAGPSIDITGASFWGKLFHVRAQGNDTGNTPSSNAAAAILIDGTGNSGNGLIQMYDINTAQGGIKAIQGTNQNEFNVRDLTTEGQAAEPAVEIANTGGADITRATIDSVEVADPIGTVFSVENDNTTGNGIFVSHTLGGTSGPMVNNTPDPFSQRNATKSPLQERQNGFVEGWVYGKRDDVQRAGDLTPVRFTNAAVSSNCSSWAAFSLSITCGQTDVYGGTSGGVSSGEGSNASVRFTPGSSGIDSVSLSVGEVIIGGFWSSSTTANGYSGNPLTPAQIIVQGTGFTTVGSCDGDSMAGDGQFTWNRCFYTVTAIGTNPATVLFLANADSTHHVLVFAPVLNFIPPSTVSINELYAYYNSFRPYDTTCTVGSACNLNSVPLQIASVATMSGNLPLNFTQGGGACNFGSPSGIAWQICSNNTDLQVEHPGSGGSGRFHVDSDFLVGPPGTATSGGNFNSFAWDNEGSYFDGTNPQNNLWEHAVSTTPATGGTINSRENIWPLFTGTCSGCTADLAIGGSGTNPSQGNLSGPPVWDFPVLPNDGFTATLTHSFTANRSLAFGDVGGTVAVVTGSPTTGNCPAFGTPATSIVDSGAPCGGSLKVNSVAVSNPNINGTTPAADTGFVLGTWKVSGSNISVELPTSGLSFPLAANQPSNGSDTILYTRATDTSPTGYAWRLQNNAGSSTIAYLDVNGNISANTLTLTNQSTFTLSPTGSVQPFFYAESATSGSNNTAPGYFEASASPANTYNSFLFPCQAAGNWCESSTTPSADSSQTLVVHGPVNAQTGTTYTISSTDEDGLTTFNNASSIAVTLACPSGTNFKNGWKDDLQMIGAGTPTITVSGCTLNGGTTLAVPTTGIHLVSDGTNYRAIFNGSGGGAVTSVFGRTGAVVAAANDYTLDQIGNPAANKSFNFGGFTLGLSWTSGQLTSWDTNGNPTFGLSSYTTAITNSPSATFAGSYENAVTPTYAEDSWAGQLQVGSGLNGTSKVNWTHSGTSGALSWDFSNGGAQNTSLTIGPTTSSTAALNGVQTIFGAGSSQGSLGFRVGASGGNYTFQNSSGVTEFSIAAASGVIASVGTVNTAGQGIPVERYNTSATNQTASIGATTMVTAPAADTNYEFQAYVGQLNAGTTCTTAGSVGVNVVYTDPVTGSVYTFVMDVQLSGGTLLGTTVPLSSSTLTVGNTGSFRFSFRAKASTNVQFSTTYTAGSCVTGQAYNIYPKLFQQ